MLTLELTIEPHRGKWVMAAGRLFQLGASVTPESGQKKARKG
jgi:hypothetical protein